MAENLPLPAPAAADIDDTPPDIDEGLAWALHSPDRINEIAERFDMQSSELMARLATADGYRRAVQAREPLRASGALVKDQSLILAEKVLDLMEKQIAEGLVSPGTAAKYLDVLAKTADLSGARAEARKASAPVERLPLITIVIPGCPDLNLRPLPQDDDRVIDVSEAAADDDD